MLCGIVITLCIASIYFRISVAGGLDNWQYFNIGQTVNDIKGKYGVDINLGLLRNTAENDNSVIVAVVDSGLYIEGKNLRSHIYVNTSEIAGNGIDDDNNGFTDDINGWDFYNNDNSLYDCYAYDYHATYIANEIIKVNDNAQILPCKILKGSKGDAADAVAAIEYAISNGARVINCSWTFTNSDDELEKIICDNPNVVFVCSVGNTNTNLANTEIFPACWKYDNIIAVGAISNTGDIYRYGGYGKEIVDILAPGENILGCFPEDDADYVSGTSIAAAYVSGVASLLYGKNDELTASEIRSIIIDTAKKRKMYENICVAEGYLDATKAYNNTASK